MADDPTAAPATSDDSNDEVVLALNRLIEQARDGSTPVASRIVAAIAARNYLEALTRRLVNEARDEGTSWEELGKLFGTSPVNTRARYGDYRSYDD